MPAQPEPIRFLPPEVLLQDIEIPSRANAKTAGDLVRLLLADEQAMRLKNADMKVLRDYTKAMLAKEKGDNAHEPRQ